MPSSAPCSRDFKPIGSGDEGLWYVYADDRKRSDGEAHVIPLPLAAWQCYLRASEIARARGSEWLFPQTRPRRRGGEVTHLHGSTLTHVMHDLPGITSTPHHIRSIFATYGEALFGLFAPDNTAHSRPQRRRGSQRRDGTALRAP